MIAAYHRQTGRYDEATRVLTRALNIAVERGLATRMISSSIDLARVHLDAGRYEEARGLLVKALTDESGRRVSGRMRSSAWRTCEWVDSTQPNRSSRSR